MTTQTLEQRVVAFASAVGADIKLLLGKQGDLATLNTTHKSTLVGAINELLAAIGSAGASIDDMAGDGNTGVTWSANKIHDTIEAAKLAVKNELTNGAGAALDTLAELADAINNDPSFATTLATQISARVRFDAAQTLTTAQKTQACANIGAVELAAVGNPDRDLAAVYAAAKA